MKILSLSICLIIALAVFVALGVALTGCGYQEGETIPESQQPTTVVIDSCEYFRHSIGGGGIYTHKGNCKNCRKFYTELHGATL